ncbi:MAG TPA: sodium:calcium antiporter [Terriglobia bacterium]|nr:sodium:calcium antiporter [Terriglobia bacterium]
MVVWLQFVICTLVIVYGGSRLSRYGDVIAEKTGMGRTWIGVVLMASATSLPELFTGISSVAIFNSPDIAAGDVLGSCMFNLLILAMLDVGRRVAPISTLAHQGQILTASFGVLLLGLTTISLLAGRSIPTMGWIGVYSLVIPIVYLGAMRLVFIYERRRIAEFLSEVKEEARYEHVSKFVAYRRFAFFALIIVIAASYLPYVAGQLATITGLGRTFVGSILVALSTSLPEIVVGRAALQMGAVDLAVGNVLGSNLFNLLILAIDDVFFLKGPLLSSVSATHAVTACAAMTMTAITMIALMYRSKKRVLLCSWDSIGVFLVYIVTVMLLYLKR